MAGKMKLKIIIPIIITILFTVSGCALLSKKDETATPNHGIAGGQNVTLQSHQNYDCASGAG